MTVISKASLRPETVENHVEHVTFLFVSCMNYVTLPSSLAQICFHALPFFISAHCTWPFVFMLLLLFLWSLNEHLQQPHGDLKELCFNS